MWYLKGFNAAYCAYEVVEEVKDLGFGQYFANRDIEQPRRFFYAHGKTAKDLETAAQKAIQWIQKVNI